MNANITQETIDLAKQAFANPSADLAKSVSTATGLVGYDLQAPAKNLYPYLAPLVGTIPRVQGDTGTATNWRVVSGITGSGYNSNAFVPEGQRTARMSYTTANKAAAYATIGEEDQVSYEAVTAARGFEDLRATAAMRLIQKIRMKEEDAILGANTSIALGVPSTPTVANTGTGGSIAAGTYNVYVVALTYAGQRDSSVSGGVVTTQTVTGADGLTYTQNGGSSNKSAAGSTTTSGSTSVITATVTPVVGAVAYAWFVGTAGNEKITAITTINSVSVSTLVGQGTQLASAITADNSKLSSAFPAFDGLLTYLYNQGGINLTTLATGTAGVGTPLTSSGRGSIVEIDNLLQAAWDNYRISPTVLYCNSQELKNITNKVLTSSSGPLLRYTDNQGGSGSPYGINASGVIQSYYNPFALDGGIKIPVKIHPTLPAGTILAYCEKLPAQYQSNNVPNVAEVRTRRDYYAIDWPARTRQYEFGCYAEEVLAVYAPFALFGITNIANG